MTWQTLCNFCFVEGESYVSYDASVPFFRPPVEADLEHIIALEAAGYPADEAATPERLRCRRLQPRGPGVKERSP
jgi:hypothetical protein